VIYFWLLLNSNIVLSNWLNGRGSVKLVISKAYGWFNLSIFYLKPWKKPFHYNLTTTGRSILNHIRSFEMRWFTYLEINLNECLDISLASIIFSICWKITHFLPDVSSDNSNNLILIACPFFGRPFYCRKTVISSSFYCLHLQNVCE
jgi:hypothetical protein